MVQYYVVRHLHWSFSFAIVAFEEILPEEEAYIGYASVNLILLVKYRS
jgi:hypothetical protein